MSGMPTKPLLDDLAVSPLVHPDSVAYVDAPFTDRNQAYYVLSSFETEADQARDSYGERTGRWLRFSEIGRPAEFVEASDCPAMARRRQDTKALNAIKLAAENATTAELKALGEALTLNHTGDLEARVKEFIARLDLPAGDLNECADCGRSCSC